MGEIQVVMSQVTKFFILMAIGFVAAKCKVLKKEILDGIMKFIVKIALPCLICSVVLGGGMKAADFIASAGFGLAILVCYAILLFTGLLTGKILRQKGTTYNVFAAEFTFGDMGFIGIPLLTAMFGGPQTSIAISIYTIIDMALVWTLGVYLCSRHQDKKQGGTPIWKNMISPVSVVLVVSIFWILLGIPVPEALMSPIASLGSTSTPLALIFIGGMLAFVPVKSLLRRKSIFGIVVVKMIALPLLVFAAVGLFFNSDQQLMLMYMVSLPAMTTISMIAAMYDSDQEYATSTVFVTTLACILTLPLITWVTGA